MTKILVTFFIFLIIISSSRVSRSQQVQTFHFHKDTTDINPNGSSELSVLMRKMYDHAVAARKDVMIKKLENTFPKEFLSIYTAKPTDSLTKNPSFNPFADGYIQSLNTFIASSQNDLVQNYNGIVNACISCHSQHCPGPVPKMKKLLIVSSTK